MMTSSASVTLPPSTAATTAVSRARTCSNLSFYRPRIRNLSRVFTQQHFEVLWNWVPMQYRGMEPTRIFSNEENGCSLTTFFVNCPPTIAPTLLLIRTTEGASVWRLRCRTAGSRRIRRATTATARRLSFAWRRSRCIYRWTHGNDELFQIATRDYIAVGGNALWIDDEMWQGLSEPGKTFGNECLVSAEAHKKRQFSFNIAALEVYMFEEPGDLTAAERRAPLDFTPAPPAPPLPASPTPSESASSSRASSSASTASERGQQLGASAHQNQAAVVGRVAAATLCDAVAARHRAGRGADALKDAVAHQQRQQQRRHRHQSQGEATRRLDGAESAQQRRGLDVACCADRCVGRRGGIATAHAVGSRDHARKRTEAKGEHATSRGFRAQDQSVATATTLT
jgi:hypothetical protein